MDITRETLNQFHTLEELRRNFNLGELVELAESNLLQDWLEEHFYSDQALALNRDKIKILSSDQLRLAICEELNLDLMSLSEYDTRQIEHALGRRRKKYMYVNREEGDPAGEIVENQAELMDMLFKDCTSVIYLCGGEFQIPLGKKAMTYIGRESAVVNVASRKRVSFDAADIRLKDLTIFLKYITPEDVEANNSENLKFIRGDKIALDKNLSQRDIYSFIQGRGAFETFEEFTQRSIKMRGIVVGETLLEAEDFDINNKLFELWPSWHVDFVKIVRKFAGDKYFSILVDANVAKEIYDNERKQLIFADFSTNGNEAVIKTLFLQTETAGRIEILVTDKPPAQAIKDIANYGSGSGGRGYGLDLINAYINHKETTL